MVINLLTQVGPNDPMIEGFKEGVRLLKEGDKAILFLPYTMHTEKWNTRNTSSI